MTRPPRVSRRIGALLARPLVVVLALAGLLVAAAPAEATLIARWDFGLVVTLRRSSMIVANASYRFWHKSFASYATTFARKNRSILS